MTMISSLVIQKISSTRTEQHFMEVNLSIQMNQVKVSNRNNLKFTFTYISIASSSSKIYNPCKVTGEKTLDGYRSLNLIANSVPDCIHLREGAHDNSPNYIYFGLIGSGGYFTRALLVDCLLGKIKLNEQRFLQMTKTILQMKKR